MKYIDFEYNINNDFDVDIWSKKATRAYTDLHAINREKMNGWLDIEKIIKNEDIEIIKNFCKRS